MKLEADGPELANSAKLAKARPRSFRTAHLINFGRGRHNEQITPEVHGIASVDIEPREAAGEFHARVRTSVENPYESRSGNPETQKTTRSGPFRPGLASDRPFGVPETSDSDSRSESVNERAAIREHLGEYERTEAERLALGEAIEAFQHLDASGDAMLPPLHHFLWSSD